MSSVALFETSSEDPIATAAKNLESVGCHWVVSCVDRPKLLEEQGFKYCVVRFRPIQAWFLRHFRAPFSSCSTGSGRPLARARPFLITFGVNVECRYQLATRLPLWRS